MAETLGKSWIDEALEIGEKRGEARGEKRGILLASRKHLRQLLEKRFGELPEPCVRRIDESDDLPKLEAAILNVLFLQKLDDLQL